MMDQCRILRKYASDCELNTAVEKAVNYCVQNDILAEFLRKNRSEVIATSIFKYNSGFLIEKIEELLLIEKETIQEWIKKSTEN